MRVEKKKDIYIIKSNMRNLLKKWGLLLVLQLLHEFQCLIFDILGFIQIQFCIVFI